MSQALRDRLVYGLHVEYAVIQEKLLTMADLTFKTAIETAIGMEQAELHTKEFKYSVHKVTYKSVRGTSRSDFARGHRSGASSNGFGHGGNSSL